MNGSPFGHMGRGVSGEGGNVEVVMEVEGLCDYSPQTVKVGVEHSYEVGGAYLGVGMDVGVGGGLLLVGGSVAARGVGLVGGVGEEVGALPSLLLVAGTAPVALPRGGL